MATNVDAPQPDALGGDSHASRSGGFKAARFDAVPYGLWPRADRLLSQPVPRATVFLGKEPDHVAHCTALLRVHLPNEADTIIHEADNICRHEFHLLGYEKLDYGPNIDWHSDPVHGKRSPMTPWFKIDFLDVHAVGDHKVMWELNRHQHLVTLAKAWCLPEVESISVKWRSSGIRGKRQIRIRSASTGPARLKWASAACRGSGFVIWSPHVRTSLFPSKPILRSLCDRRGDTSGGTCRRIFRRTLTSSAKRSRSSSSAAYARRFLRRNAGETKAGELFWKNLNDKFVQTASTSSSRSITMSTRSTFSCTRDILPSQSGLAIPELFDTALKKMLDVIQALSDVGPVEGFGDDDGGRVFNPRRNQLERMTDPLALGSVLYGRDKYRVAGPPKKRSGCSAIKPSRYPRSRFPSWLWHRRSFESGGIYLINDPEPCPQQLMIDAGPQGTGHSGHGHADALSVRLSFDGHRFLVDPGTYCYVSDGQERDWFRGTGAHNTLRVDNLDQSVPEGPFAWRSIPTVKAETWLNGQTFDFFVGSHNGYCRLPEPVLHRRSVFHVKAGMWFVRDSAEGQGPHLLESFWHFAPELEVREERGMVFAESIRQEYGTRLPRVACRSQFRLDNGNF